ncbi:MAG TPA: IS66 family insertion sequence element accessory protein TnpB [Chthonomonadales bacterium]|nr:IS66 family insertion sequence element accessory protein TnpB [Chthonomonadales bacterium]
MLSVGSGRTVYLCCGSTDMRKSINGLAALVGYAFDLDVFSRSLFVFCNKERNKLKILFWEHNGFWLYYRRLERGRFRWPEGKEAEAYPIAERELGWLLDGLALTQRQAHKAVNSTIAA